MRRLAIFLALVFLVVLGVLVSLSLSYRGFDREIFVRLERGTGTPAMAKQLAEAGVIRYAWQFELERALHPSARLSAGEYRFNAPASAGEVFDRIARGDIFYFDVNVPEGSNMFDVARIVESAGAVPAADFLKAAEDPALIHDLDPSAKTLEGYLFPATYRLSHSTTAAELCKMMTAQFRREWKKIANGAPADPHRTVTLASLVEKETGVAQERPLVASVFQNRLDKNMALDCDPTVIYAALLENRYRGTIYRSDLNRHNLYNTYQNPGLPPGPIANPGAEAIAAALHPAETDYLYFVAKASGGGHNFSSTLAAHEKAVQSYRHATKGAKANGKKG